MRPALKCRPGLRDLFEVADPAQVRNIPRTVHLQPKGLVSGWPYFARFSHARPGRHNVLVWPMASGMWAHAAAKAGAVERFADEMTHTASMANASQGIFYEFDRGTSSHHPFEIGVFSTVCGPFTALLSGPQLSPEWPDARQT